MPIQTRITWAITIHVQAPFSTASALPARFGIDTPLLRNHQGEVIIPSTLVQGRLFEEATNWPGFETLKKHLGDPAQDNEPANTVAQGNVPHRKQLVFGDFVMAESPPAGTTQAFTRIKIDEATGAVQTGALQVIEQAALAGKSLEFKGTLTGYVDVGATAEDALTKQLRAALGLIPNLGGERSVGYGVVTGVTVERPIAANTATFTWPNGATAAALTLRFDRPVLVAEPNPNANLFKGSTIIPGNAIKGALADTLLAVIGRLPTGFDELIIRHGFCAAGGTRPRAIPLSLSEFETAPTQVVDLATRATPVVLGSGAAAMASKFAIDWKPDYFKTPSKDIALTAHFGWHHPGRDLRVHVAIDPATRAAEDKKLFAYDAVLHEQRGSKPYNANAWHTILDLHQVATELRPALITALNKAFASGLFPLGKTKAVASVAMLRAHTPAALQAAALATPVILTLQTPALLTAKGALAVGAGQAELTKAYAAYFATHGLTLSHFYARQTLRGGGYQQRRFQGTRTYAPWLLTDAGSVFVLTVTTPEGSTEPTESANTAAHAKLTQWLNQGLPVASGWPDKWQTNPYLPENGFGEVLINQAEHAAWSPKTLGITAHSITSLVA